MGRKQKLKRGLCASVTVAGAYSKASAGLVQVLTPGQFYSDGTSTITADLGLGGNDFLSGRLVGSGRVSGTFFTSYHYHALLAGVVGGRDPQTVRWPATGLGNFPFRDPSVGVWRSDVLGGHSTYNLAAKQEYLFRSLRLSGSGRTPSQPRSLVGTLRGYADINLPGSDVNGASIQWFAIEFTVSAGPFVFGLPEPPAITINRILFNDGPFDFFTGRQPLANVAAPDFVAVPEPAPTSLFLLSLGASGVLARRRARSIYSSA